MPGPAYAPIAPRTDRDHFTISDLSAEFAVTARALRFYEDEGLIGKRVGFSLGEIREMMDLYDLGDGRRVQRQVAIDRCRSRIALLEAQKHDIDAAITELTDFVTVLEAGRAQPQG